MNYKPPFSAILGILLLAIGVVFGYYIYRPGYGAGPQGVMVMLLGIGIALLGSIASLICGIVSLIRKERPLGIGLLASVPPVFLFILCVSGVIRL
jgi:hypothetical protein